MGRRIDRWLPWLVLLSTVTQALLLAAFLRSASRQLEQSVTASDAALKAATAAEQAAEAARSRWDIETRQRVLEWDLLRRDITDRIDRLEERIDDANPGNPNSPP